MDASKMGLHAGNGTEKRREHDFYPTPWECSQALLNFMNFNKSFLFWEPAAGTGNISKLIEKNGYTVFSSDINKDCYGLGGVDFLNFNISPIANRNIDCIITNPPFNLSEEFIKKSLSLSSITCMLLKSQYWHSKGRLKLFNDHKPSFVLPLTWRPNFRDLKKSHPTMEVAWTVWISGKEKCIYQPLEKPKSTLLLFQ